MEKDSKHHKSLYRKPLAFEWDVVSIRTFYTPMIGFRALTMLGEEIKGYRLSLKLLGLMGMNEVSNHHISETRKRSTQYQEEIDKIETQAFPLSMPSNRCLRKVPTGAEIPPLRLRSIISSK